MNGSRGPKKQYPQRIDVRLTGEQFEYLEKEAKKENATIADIVRGLIDKARKRH